METTNHESYVSLEVAKLLKETGFDWKTKSYYVDNNHDGKFILLCGYNNSITNWNAKQFFMRDSDGSVFVNNGTYKDSITGDYITSSFFSAPALEVAQRWLREAKGYIILVNYNEFLKTFYYSICYTKNTNRYIDDRDDCRNTSFEEAQEAGIKKTLEIILEK